MTLLAGAGPAAAFEFFDGRLQVHGYYQQNIRAMGRNLQPIDDIDLAQWQQVLSIEVEGSIAPNGIGPIEILDFFARVEARYDCVWTRACGMFPSANVYGDRAAHFPLRLVDGRQGGFTGNLFNADRRRNNEVTRDNYQLAYRFDGGPNGRQPLSFDQLPGFVSLFGNGDGPNQEFEPIGTASFYGDDPPPFIASKIISHCVFGAKQIRGGENGHATQILGPWNPNCRIHEIGSLRFMPNPFNGNDFNPILAGVDRIPGTADDPLNPATNRPITPTGRGQFPFRPAPFRSNADSGASLEEARGLYYPSAGLINALDGKDLDDIDQNFSEQELAWNRGASQQDEKELKEAYLDLEAAEGRLWLRLGKQAIVWGKTELFRNTDQFNPQDLALASLPGLEESRIALWAARGTWSFYNIGPLEDVRLELAMNLDDFEPADLGRCGEPFAFDQVCNLTFGYFAHGFAGAGLAGNDKPPNPWQDIKGLEGGARVEFRYGRFSFQISDFYGYDDFPTPVRIATYARNVDPWTGMPRRFGATGRCTTNDSRIEPDCLGRPNGIARSADGNPLREVDFDGDGVTEIYERNSPGIGAFIYKTGNVIIDPRFKADVIANHPANQTAYALANAATCGAAGLDVDPSLCGFVSFNGKEGPAPLISTVANGASGVLAGSPAAFNSAVANGFIPDVPTLNLVALHQQANDPVLPLSDGGSGPFASINEALGQYLTPQQEALLGCGPFWLIDCDDDGIDMLNAEGSVLVQSFPGFEGTFGTADSWDVAIGPQPGTVPGAQQLGGGPVASRWTGQGLVRLPGSRGYYDEFGNRDRSYDSEVDGCSIPIPGDPNCAGMAALVHPLTGQAFRTELAVVSWNFLMTLASRSDPKNPAKPTLSEFSASDPDGLRGGTTPVACGLRKPQLCSNVQGFLSGLGVARNTVRAGGNGPYGRRDFAWQSSGELVLTYEKRNILGFAFDFAEERTKTNWGVEATWVAGQSFLDNDEFDNLSTSDTLNLTVSVDRPTFINFLNANRTFFFNSQWFFQYIDNYQDGYLANGPLNVLATFTALTGYHQDRLLTSLTAVYDFHSNSGAVLPQVTYRFTENLSASVGSNFFFGRQQLVDSAVSELRAGLNRVGSHAYKDAVENGLAVLRERDEVFLTLRYTF